MPAAPAADGHCADTQGTAAHHFHQFRAAAQIGDEAVDFGLTCRQFDDEAVRGRVQYPPTPAHHLAAHGIRLAP